MGEAYSQYDRDRAIAAQVEELGRYLVGRDPFPRRWRRPLHPHRQAEGRAGAGLRPDLVAGDAPVPVARTAGEPKAAWHADTWVFASAVGHVRGDSLTRHGVLANHALRRAYATAATNAGVDEDTVGKLLNHGGPSVTARHNKTSYPRRKLAAAPEGISAHLVRAPW